MVNLKKYFIAMAVYTIPFLIIVICCSVRTNYSITTPGGVSKVDQRFSVENGYESNNLYSLYVYSTKNSTIFQNVIADIFTMFDKSEISNDYDHMTDELWSLAGLIQKNQSLETSMINAYEYASLEDSSIKIEYEYLGAIVNATSADNNVFEIGDILTHINNEKIVSKNQFYDKEREDYITFKIGDVVSILRNNNEIDITLKEGDILRSGFYDKFNIISSTPSCSITPSNSSGPSAGMMQTISIYNQLTKDNITIKDNKQRIIAGTGTIETDGTIGKIGGMTQKVYSAFNANADILLVSKDNEEEALKAYNSLINKERMQLIIVSNFNEVIQCLK